MVTPSWNGLDMKYRVLSRFLVEPLVPTFHFLVKTLPVRGSAV